MNFQQVLMYASYKTWYAHIKILEGGVELDVNMVSIFGGKFWIRRNCNIEESTLNPSPAKP